MEGLNSFKFNGEDICEKYDGLILKHVSVEPPTVQTNFLEIPLRNGSIDLTEALTDAPRYNDRNVLIDVKYLGENLVQTHSKFLNDWHGKRIKILFDEDPNFYYIGRLSVGAYEVTRHGGTFSMTAQCEPFKYSATSSSEEWEWDPFDFEEGYLNEFKNLQISGSETIILIADENESIATVTTDAVMKFTFKEENITVPIGTTKLYFTLPFEKGENTITITGTGTVTIDYRGGRL